MTDLPVPNPEAQPETVSGEITYPVQKLDLVLRACNAGVPLPPKHPCYADFSDLRQGVSVMQFEQELRAQRDPNTYLHACLSGHRGSGKSTELLALKEWADTNGFLTVRTEVDEVYGMISLESADLFLLAARAVEEAMAAFGQPLPQDKLENVAKWFAVIVQEDTAKVESELKAEATAQLGLDTPFSLVRLFAKFTAGLKASSEHAIKTRQHIRNYPDSLSDLTKSLLNAANVSLKNNGRTKGLLLLFDNLDRYEPEVIDKALMRGSSLVGQLACHAIFTIPISLEYEPLTAAMQDCYGFPIVLPMLSLRRKPALWKESAEASAYEPSAVSKMRDALGKRIEITHLFENPDDADLLVKMSGGCIRDLMHLVTLSFSLTYPAQQLTPRAVQKAIRQMRATYLRQLNSDDYARLAHIAYHKTMRVEPDAKEAAAQKRRLLFHRYALEYMDQKDEPWIDVHPLVVGTEEFQREYANVSSLTKP